MTGSDFPLMTVVVAIGTGVVTGEIDPAGKVVKIGRGGSMVTPSVVVGCVGYGIVAPSITISVVPMNTVWPPDS
jgi:hypothetical protein